jgi:formiminotetrahydrofolate cyclodeaminase
VEDGRSYLKAAVDEYLRELSGRKIVPGGGSAAALTASLGAGLNLMVINYSKTGGHEKESPLGALAAEQEKSMEKLSALIDTDCRAFAGLMQALSSGKDAQEEYKAAAGAPMDICKECFVSVKIAASLLEIGNKSLITDVGCAAAVLEGAFRAAALNVEINLKKIEDPAFVEDLKSELCRMEKDITGTAGKTISRVEEIIKKGK